jgi:hypothetical protein
MKHFACPYLSGEVELTEEREKHIAERHPDFLPKYEAKIAEVLLNPEQIRRSKNFPSARLFTRWFTDVRGGKFVVIIVVTDTAREGRHWIVTGYVARKIQEGEIEWKQN